jgi:LDH2 family malate/lactate/ureidoglycolate dehydrogenase
VALAIDTFMPVADFKRAVDGVVRDIRNSQKLAGVERIWLPGEQSAEKLADRTKNGIPMPKSLRDDLDAVAREVGVEPLG